MKGASVGTTREIVKFPKVPPSVGGSFRSLGFGDLDKGV